MSTSRPRALPVYVAGVLLALWGVILPWYREGGVSVWGWDVSVLWSLTGRTDVLKSPPASAAIVLAGALVLAVPLLRGRVARGPIAAAAAALVLSICGLSVYRGSTMTPAITPHVGLLAGLAGGVLAAIAALVFGDEEG